MSEDAANNNPDPKEAAPLQLAPPKPPRKRTSFLKHKFSSSIVIREADKDRAKARVTKIPATLQDGKARMLIVATKMLNRMERRLDLMEDADAQMTPKECKEFNEALEKTNELMKDAFGVESGKVSAIPAATNNGIIINGAGGDEVSRLFDRVAAKATAKPVINVTPTNEPGTDQPNP